MVCLALELVGPWVVLGFSVGMEAFDELLSINGVRSSLVFSGFGQMKSFSTVRDTQRGSQSYMEKRRGRRKREVIRRRRGGVKRGETNLASNQFPKCSPQPGTPREIHRVK